MRMPNYAVAHAAANGHADVSNVLASRSATPVRESGEVHAHWHSSPAIATRPPWQVAVAGDERVQTPEVRVVLSIITA